MSPAVGGDRLGDDDISWQSVLSVVGCYSDNERAFFERADTKLLPITSPNINRFLKFLSLVGLGSKFATYSCLNIPPRRKHVATLPCEV